MDVHSHHDGLRDVLRKRLATHLSADTHEEQQVRDMAQSATVAKSDIGVHFSKATTHVLDVAVVETYSTSTVLELQRQQRAGEAEASEAKHQYNYGSSTLMLSFVVDWPVAPRLAQSSTET